MGIGFLKGQRKNEPAKTTDEFLNIESPAGLDTASKIVANQVISVGLSGGNPNIVSDVMGNVASGVFNPRKGTRKKTKLL